jgi:putative ABC transport system permease protein
MLVPLRYTFRSLFVRKSATVLTLLGLASTVAVLAGVLALRAGFTTLFSSAGRDDVAIFMRPGAMSENQSFFRRDLGDRLIKTLPEIAKGSGPEGGAPLASMVCASAARLRKHGGSGRDETNVPIRGVQPELFAIYDQVKLVEGRRFEFGNDEVIVGKKLGTRIQACAVGDVLTLNTTPFRVVGVFSSDGPFDTEVWGDFERIGTALHLGGPTTVVARLRSDIRDDPARKDDPFDLLALRLEADKETPASVLTDRAYLLAQTEAIGGILLILGGALSVIMGVAAVFTATNTMLAAVAGRTREIGILLSIGFRPFPIFLSFVFESVLLGLLGGAIGCLLALPINGIETGTTNFQTFTEVAFAFRLTPDVLTSAITFALALGLLGGAIPAWRAARLAPTEALRRR